MTSKSNKWPPVHPGEILLHEYLKPLNMNASELGREISVPSRRVREILQGKRNLTGDMALRLARYFGTSPELWMDLQADYELDLAQDELEGRLEREVAVRAA